MGDDALAYWALRSHVVTGTVALVMGAVALVARKGGHWHRHCGRVYVWFMALVCASAVVVAVHDHEPFLLDLALFVFYLAFSGRRSLARRRAAPRPRAAWVDWLAVATAAGATVGLAGQARAASSADVRVISACFATLSAFVVAADVWEIVGVPPLPRPWWCFHMLKMVGSFIGAVTAVIVVQVPSLPFIVRYVGPPLVLIPLLLAWMAYYWLRFRRPTSAQRPAVRALRAAAG
ncbi:MAG TPA: hypothetical protein VFD84_16905 [Candidatus Binatia bacterium]|nr:hypothetical protein [Candidatus Binatia bacterium]